MKRYRLKLDVGENVNAIIPIKSRSKSKVRKKLKKMKKHIDSSKIKIEVLVNSRTARVYNSNWNYVGFWFGMQDVLF